MLRWFLGLNIAGAASSEMRYVNGRGKGMDIAVAVALRFVQTLAACKDQVSTFEQSRIAVQQSRVREPEGGQFIHAVVDDRGGIDMLGEREHYLCIEPREQMSAASKTGARRYPFPGQPC